MVPRFVALLGALALAACSPPPVALPPDAAPDAAADARDVAQADESTPLDVAVDAVDAAEPDTSAPDGLSASDSATDAGAACDGARVTCESECVDLSSNPLNCGACGHSCIGSHVEDATCALGWCHIVCMGGSGDCDNDPENGCEALTNVDPHNCGACGFVCFRAGEVCRTGQCVAP